MCNAKSKFSHDKACSEKTGLRGVQTRSDTNRAVQPQKMIRALKFWIEKLEGSYHLCFRICKKQLFSQRGSNKNKMYLYFDYNYVNFSIKSEDPVNAVMFKNLSE